MANNLQIKQKKTRCNIAHITLSMATGGVEKLIVTLAKYSDREKWHVIVICLDSGGDLIAELAELGVETLVIGRRPGLDFTLFFKLARIFREKKIQVVHSHNQAAHFYAAPSARLACVPTVVTTEHSRHNTERHLRRRLEKRILGWLTNTWVVVNDELASLAVEKDGIASDKVKVINNGIDVGRFSRPADWDAVHIKRSLGLPGDSRFILMVARLHPIKNHALLLEAFALIHKQFHNLHVVLVGEGECRPALQEQAAKNNLSKRVHFLGLRTDIPELLWSSDVFVLCSTSEGLPVSLLEACAASVPVLITKSANRAGFIKSMNNGLVVDESSSELANGLSILLNDSDRAMQLASRGYRQIQEKYTISAMMRMYIEIESSTK